MEDEEKGDKPYYTTEPVAGSYIPYGSRLRICKGRFYSKQEALGSIALFLTIFDIEFVEGEVPEQNMKYFAFGVVPPMGPVPARMRRRNLNST
jgi:hypothetical protein